MIIRATFPSGEYLFIQNEPTPKGCYELIGDPFKLNKKQCNRIMGVRVGSIELFQQAALKLGVDANYTWCLMKITEIF